MKRKDHIAYIAIPIFIIVIVALRNIIPDEYIVAGGDFVQSFNNPRFLSNTRFSWSNESLGYAQISQSYYFYYIFFSGLSEVFNLSVSEQSILYYVIFLTVSFLSFYFAALYFGNLHSSESGGEGTKMVWASLFSLGYSFNIFTFYGFVGLWNFGPFLILYSFVPLVFLSTHKYLVGQANNYYNILLLSISFFLVSISSGNLPFTVALSILLLFFIFFIFWKSNIDSPFKKISVYILLFTILTFWSWSHQLFELFGATQAVIQENSELSLSDWIIGQSAQYPDPFLLAGDRQFFMKYPTLILSTIFVLILAILTLITGRNNNSRIVIIFLAMYVITLFLLNKGKGFLPNDVTLFLFSNFILASLRSFHKTLIFLPFFVFIIAYLGVIHREISGNTNKILKIVVITVVIIPIYYFARGGILTEHSYNYANKDNYLTSDISPVVKIPDEYYDVSKIVNSDTSVFRILSLPNFIYDEAYTWRKIPKIKYQGTNSNPFWQLFNAPIVDMSDLDRILINGFKVDSDMVVDSEFSLTKIMGLINAKYILLHKDSDAKYWFKYKTRFDKLVDQGALDIVSSNNYLTLYKLNNKYRNNRIYLKSKPNKIQKNALFDFKYLEDIDLGSTNVFFQRYNPTLYKVQLNGINGNYSLVFLESFRKGWNAYIDNNIYNCSNYSNSKNSNKKDNNSGVKQGELLKLCDHSFYDSWFMPNVDKYNIKDGSRRTMGNYANIWNINVDKICNNSNICVSNGDGSYDISIVIEYLPQRLVYLGYILLAFVAIVLLYLTISTVIRKNTRQTHLEIV